MLQCTCACCSALQCVAVYLHLVIVSWTQCASESEITDLEIAIAVEEEV